MSSSAQQQGTESVLSEQQVVDYLRGDPEFFARQPELVAAMRIPHGQDGAVSLLEHQVQVLRAQGEEARDKLKQLLGNARDNEELSQRMHRLTLALIECRAADEVFAALYEMLGEQFAADAAAVRVLVPPRNERDAGLGEFVSVEAGARAEIERVLANEKPVCGRLPAAQAELMFGARATEIASAALLPLGEPERFGVLAIGSSDPQRFHPGMGTMFLRNLGEIVTRVLQPHVELG